MKSKSVLERIGHVNTGFDGRSRCVVGNPAKSCVCQPIEAVRKSPFIDKWTAKFA